MRANAEEFAQDPRRVVVEADKVDALLERFTQSEVDWEGPVAAIEEGSREGEALSTSDDT